MVVSVYLIFSVRLFGKIIKSVNFLTPCSKGILLATLCFGSLRRITNAFESFLADFAVRKGVSLSGRNGILQKRDALSAHISKKHRGMIEFVGQVRNAADHGADPDENNQVWTISNETARIYPCIIAALIKAIFSRDATGSIEV